MQQKKVKKQQKQYFNWSLSSSEIHILRGWMMISDKHSYSAVCISFSCFSFFYCDLKINGFPGLYLPEITWTLQLWVQPPHPSVSFSFNILITPTPLKLPVMVFPHIWALLLDYGASVSNVKAGCLCGIAVVVFEEERKGVQTGREGGYLSTAVQIN